MKSNIAHTIPYYTYCTSYLRWCFGAFGRLWMLSISQRCFASRCITLPTYFIQSAASHLKGQASFHTVECCTAWWRNKNGEHSNQRRHCVFLHTDVCLSPYLRCKYVCACVRRSGFSFAKCELLSFPPHLSQRLFPLDIVGSSSAPLVLLETPLSVLLSRRLSGLSIVGFSFTQI